MRNKENIKEVLIYLQTTEDKVLDFDEGVIYEAYQKDNDNQSLAIKILTVFGGILASIMFLGFLYLSGLQNSEKGLLAVGAICIAGAVWVTKVYDKIIIDTVSISSFIIGFILLGIGFNLQGIKENTIFIIFIIIAICSLCIVQNYILSFISILIIHGSILKLIMSNNNHDLIYIYVSALALMVTYFFLKEAGMITGGKRLSRLYNPIRIGLILSFLSGLIFFGKKGILALSPNYTWLCSLTLIATIIYCVYILLDLLNVIKTQYKVSIYLASILLLLPTVFSPSISGAILIILLSFLVNYKTGFVFGIIAFIYFISQYYYDLEFTLLTKSILLFSSGVIFLTLYLFTHKKLTSDEKV